MQFDEASGKETHFEIIKKKYSDAGYIPPKIIFWNLNSKEVNVCASSSDENVALLSGYSHSLFNAVISGTLEHFTPRNVMDETLKKYNPVKVVFKNLEKLKIKTN
jgi:hypothetical protein